MTDRRHFTAWVTNDPSCLDQPNMDVTVIEDVAVPREEVVNGEAREGTEWASQGPQVFHAVTTVDAREGDAEDGIKEAEALLSAAGWKVTGTWDVTSSAYVATVERDENEGEQ